MSDPSESPAPPPKKHVHIPVLLHEVLAGLELRPGLAVVDGTVGAGGHSRRIVEKIQPDGVLIGLDRDPMMLAFAGQTVIGPHVHLMQRSYSELPDVLRELQRESVDRVLVDLGLSSDQLADRARGFGFQTGGPLDLRFDVRQGIPAAQYLAEVSVDELARVLEEYGEEPVAKRIAGAIVDRRRTNPVTTAEDLADLVRSVKGVRGDMHPATLVFQALRIAVNQELDHLKRFLDQVLPTCLVPGGVAAVITFHSLEDRLVKEAFRETGRWENLTKKPQVASPAEIRLNPRSRTAKLRLARRK
jgi:16S rRNA (cytosine1402-N4)-methyltransferase